jgi:hypothetical protein
MPIHDWTRVGDGIFHAFHNAWIAEIQKTLNNGLLPPEMYALGEQVTTGGNPDVIALEEPINLNGDGSLEQGSLVDAEGGIALLTEPPKVLLTARAEQETYTARQREIVIHHRSDHRILALIEIVSAGNKASDYALQSLVDKSLAALRQGIHLLILDLHPPGPRDPRGIHGAIWEPFTGQTYDPPAGLPLTLVAYSAGRATKNAFIQPVAVGQSLPEMPLYLTPDGYINVPLEATYQGAYEGVPRFYRKVLEAKA